MKRCSKCLVTKPLSDFVKRVDRVGHYVWCRACQATHGRDEHWPPGDAAGGLADGGMQGLEEKKLHVEPL